MLKQRSSTLSFESLFTIHNSLFPVLLKVQDRKAPILRMTLKSGHFWALLLKNNFEKHPKQKVCSENHKTSHRKTRKCIFKIVVIVVIVAMKLLQQFIVAIKNCCCDNVATRTCLVETSKITTELSRLD